MDQPWIYMCSPSRSPHLPPSPSHPSGSSQCTSPEHLSHASSAWHISLLTPLCSVASSAACLLHPYHTCWMAPPFTSPVFSGERGWVLVTQATGWQCLWFSTSGPRPSRAAWWYSCHSSNSFLPLPIQMPMWRWLSTFASIWKLQYPFLILLILLTSL